MVLQSRLARGVPELLVQWKGKPAAEASWMPLDEFRALYPGFQLEDKLLLQGGRDVRCGLHYTRRRGGTQDRRQQHDAQQQIEFYLSKFVSFILLRFYLLGFVQDFVDISVLINGGWFQINACNLRSIYSLSLPHWCDIDHGSATPMRSKAASFHLLQIQCTLNPSFQYTSL